MATQIDFPDVRIELGELIRHDDDIDDNDLYDDKDFENDDGDANGRDWRKGGGSSIKR